MRKKLALMILVLALISVFTIPSAEAESRAHRVLKALALGGLLAALPPPPPVLISPAPAPIIIHRDKNMSRAIGK